MCSGHYMVREKFFKSNHMNRYSSQLISDIKNAWRPKSLNVGYEHAVTIEEELEIVDNYTSGTNIPACLSRKCGLTIEQFPPIEALSEEEIKLIIEEFKAMLFSWHISADLPENVPLERAYTLLINILNEEAWFFPTGMLHYDFCTGYAPDCELKEYCPCKENWKD
jgi:hypothetical protein